MYHRLSMRLERYDPQQWPEMFVMPSPPSMCNLMHMLVEHIWYKQYVGLLIKTFLYRTPSCQKLHMVPLKHLKT